MLSECGTAQLSLPLFVLCSCCSRYVVFVELIHLNDLLDNITFLLPTNQRPKKIYTRTKDRKLTYTKVALAKRTGNGLLKIHCASSSRNLAEVDYNKTAGLFDKF